MFGQNLIRSAEPEEYSLRVQSIFYTLQGEGPFSGSPSVFVRLAGCNLACHFCDTEFESGYHNVMSLPHLIKAIDEAALHQGKDDGMGPGRRLIVITGGEPMRQNIGRLCRDLLAAGATAIQIETAGTLWPADFEAVMATGKVTLVCSPKTPKVHPMVESWCFHWKYIIAAGELDEQDGLPNRGTQPATKDKVQRLHRPADRGDLDTIWCSPRDDQDTFTNECNKKAAVDSCLKHGYRLSLQVHKLCNLE
jgi:7-carboxy-7-deazaguanine synthase